MKRSTEKLFLIFLALVLGLLLYTRLNYADIPFERDEGEYAYAGSLLLHGHLPYKEAYNMKFPGSYFVYAFLMKLGGETTVAVRTGVSLIILLTAFMLGYISHLITGNKTAGAVGAVVFFALGNTMWCQGLMANSEHFVNLFTVSAILFLFLFLNRGKRPGLLFIACFLMGCSVIMKQYAYPFCLFSLILLIAGMRSNSLADKLKATLVFSIGGLLPIIILFAWVIQNNLWEKFRFLTFDYARAYVGLGPGIIGGVIVGAVILCLLFAALKAPKGNIRILIGWLIVSIIAFSTGLYFRPHYFILAFPVYAIGIAYIFSALETRYGALAGKGMVTLLLLVYFGLFANQLFAKNTFQVYKDHYPNELFTDMPLVAERINTFIPQRDKLSMFSNEPELLFYSRHNSATGYLYDYPFFEAQTYAPEMLQEYLANMEANPSKLFIYSTFSLHPENPGTYSNFSKWWNQYSQHYSLKGVYYPNAQNNGVYMDERELKTDSSWKNVQHIEFWMRKG